MEPESVQPQPIQFPPPQPPPSILPEQQVAKPPQRKVFFIIVILLVLGIIGTVFMYIQKSKNEQAYLNERARIVARDSLVSVPTPTSIPTTNLTYLKTYTDPNNQYSFKYPNNYDIMSTSPNIKVGFTPLGAEQPFSYLTISDKFTVDLNNLMPCKDIKVATNSGSWEYCLDGGSGWGQSNDIESMTVGNTSAKSFYISGGVDNFYHIVQTTEKPLIEFKMYVAGGGLDRTFSQILSTFKFIDQNATKDMATWKAYTRIPNFSFKYPTTWSEQPNYSLQPADKSMTIWIEGETVGLECLSKTTSKSSLIDSQNVTIDYYAGLKSCERETDRVIFISLPSVKASFTFTYNASNQTDAEKIFDQILTTFRFVN